MTLARGVAGLLLALRRPQLTNEKQKENIMGGHNCYGKNEEECVKRKAYELWEKDGCKPGNDLHYWLDAKKTVKAHAKK